MDKLVLIFLVLLVSCSDSHPVYPDTGIVDKISRVNDSCCIITVHFKCPDRKTNYYEIEFYTNEKYNINDTIKFSKYKVY